MSMALPMFAGDARFRRSGLLQRIEEKLRGWWRLIFADAHSKKLFMFLALNLSFAFIELIYGLWSNSLSLISDSFHMFFDCTGLLAGLIASLITKWRPNDKFSYGYVRAEVLAGFVNGMFLLFIAFFIFSEALERLMEPPHIHHDHHGRLLVVSIIGFIVNLLGIFVFHDAAHGHSHGGGGHGHSHGGGFSHGSKAFENGNLVTLNTPLDASPFTQPFPETHAHSHDDDHGHSHNGGHGHSHSGGGSQAHNQNPIVASDSQIMKGVYLHIMADALGSVGVIISTLCMRQFGWMIADPICSLCISTLIGLSVLPLIKDSVYVLMMRTPRDLDNLLPGCYQKLMTIEGVYSVQEPHFWTLCSEVYVGTLKLEVSPKADPRYVITSAHSIFNQIGVRQLYVQLDFAHI